MSSAHVSPLRYPGGKAKVGNFLKLVLVKNRLVGSEYVEPYAGGASVALSLLFEEYASHIHINDLNPGVFAFWSAVLEQGKELRELILKTPVTIDEWHRQRSIYRDSSSVGLELAFSTFFLNRTNRSGIISGGVIGGLEQTGPWKIDARYNREELAHRIAKVARFRSRISLTNLDAAQLLKDWLEPSDVRALIYLDPPYFSSGNRLYDNYYEVIDHEVIASLVVQLSHPWLVSYDAAPEIIEMYAGNSQLRYKLRYSAAARAEGSEVLVTSPDLELPSVDPASVTTKMLAKASSKLFALQ